MQNEKNISVLIVDDHPAIRTGIRAMIEKTGDIYVAGEAQDGDEARRLLEELRPKVTLLDLVMPGFSPSAFERWARENYPETITLVLTSHDRDAYLASMMEAGAAGYLDKSIHEGGLVDAIRRAASGQTLFDDHQKLRARRWRKDVEKKWNSLSKREREVLRLLAMSATNKFISKELQIAPKTLEKHLQRIYQKLDVSSRSEAALWGSEHVRDFPY
ncbi:MAG TPA: response regulator transcription factor [Anaerolineales bacterium]|nr:response regulator transcription factor [Anaerolineales bacterium]